MKVLTGTEYADAVVKYEVEMELTDEQWNKLVAEWKNEYGEGVELDLTDAAQVVELMTLVRNGGYGSVEYGPLEVVAQTDEELDAETVELLTTH